MIRTAAAAAVPVSHPDMSVSLLVSAEPGPEPSNADRPEWSLLDSNQRPLRCERSALPTELSDLEYPHGESNPGLLAENQVS